MCLNLVSTFDDDDELHAGEAIFEASTRSELLGTSLDLDGAHHRDDWLVEGDPSDLHAHLREQPVPYMITRID